MASIGFWSVISALLTLHILPIPHFPLSPLFRPTSELEIRITFPESTMKEVQLRGVWLDIDDERLSYADFDLSAEWVGRSGRYFIDPALRGELFWRGKIAERAKLTIFPMSIPANITVLWDGEVNSALLDGTPVSFVRRSPTPVSYYAAIIVARFFVVFYTLFVFFSMFVSVAPQSQRIIVPIFLLTLGLLLVCAHFQSDDVKNRLDLQISYHLAILSGEAPSPWQYRVFSEWILAGLMGLLSPLGYERSFYFASMAIRIIQNILIYFLSYSYFRKLNHSASVALIGILFLSGSLLTSYYNTGISLNTYFDLIFYLVSIHLILNRSFRWLPLIMVFAALNRETSGMIPILALLANLDLEDRRSKVGFVLGALTSWTLVFFGLRVIYLDREIFIPYGQQPGIPLLVYNLFPPPYMAFLRFFSVIPILALAVFMRWNSMLKRFFIVMVPLWVAVHLVASVIAETRLFLVPQIIVFIPSFLTFVQIVWEKTVEGKSLSRNETVRNI